MCFFLLLQFAKFIREALTIDFDARFFVYHSFFRELNNYVGCFPSFSTLVLKLHNQNFDVFKGELYLFKAIYINPFDVISFHESNIGLPIESYYQKSFLSETEKKFCRRKVT